MLSFERRKHSRRRRQRRKSLREEINERRTQDRRQVDLLQATVDKQRHTPPPFNAVIFDIDNVLIDTRLSYLDAIRWTVEIYLTEGKIPFFIRPAGKSSPLLLSPQDVHQFKLLGGFNDDWDCCYGLLIYLLSRPVRKRTIAELKKAANFKKLSEQIKKRPLGVQGIVKLFGHSSSVMIEKISRIFQEVYLGRDLFRSCEHRRAIFWKRRGLINRERMIFKRRMLLKMRFSGISLGLATGRPQFEASYALRKFRIEDLFDAKITLDDVRKAEHLFKQSMRKPHPFSILETAKKMGANKNFLYVGDLPDDILAANLAKKEIWIRSVAFPNFCTDPNTALGEIQKAKPDYIVKKPTDLMKLLRI